MVTRTNLSREYFKTSSKVIVENMVPRAKRETNSLKSMRAAAPSVANAGSRLLHAVVRPVRLVQGAHARDELVPTNRPRPVRNEVRVPHVKQLPPVRVEQTRDGVGERALHVVRGRLFRVRFVAGRTLVATFPAFTETRVPLHTDHLAPVSQRGRGGRFTGAFRAFHFVSRTTRRARHVFLERALKLGDVHLAAPVHVKRPVHSFQLRIGKHGKAG